jgi:hypothetical protein
MARKKPFATVEFAMSIPNFCASHGISERMYFAMKRRGEAPVEMVVGRRRLISNEAAQQWRRAREQAAQPAA